MSGIKDSMLGDKPFTYPLAPGFLEPTTSRDAARAVSSSAPLLRERVFAAIRAAGTRGLTSDEAADAVDQTVLAVRPRVTELAKTGRIAETGERRANVSGLKANAWRAK